MEAKDLIGMTALTICQPYADLCLLPDEHPEHKRSENRRWHSGYRGPLLIHAGKSRDWLEEGDVPGHDLYGLRIDDMKFGAIVGVVDMVACFSAADIRAGNVPAAFQWLRNHQHVEGPYCHVYANPRRFAEPISARGALGHFRVTEKNLAISPAKSAAAAGDGLYV